MYILSYFEDLRDAIDAWERSEALLYSNHYPRILKDVERYGFSTVYDIGSSFGPHVELATNMGFRYIGIDESESPPFWEERDSLMNMDGLNAEFMFGMHVPFSNFKPEEGACAISICALGSLYENSDDDIQKMMSFMTTHFKHFWCFTFDESIKKMCGYWKHYETLFQDSYGGNVTHFWN